MLMKSTPGVNLYEQLLCAQIPLVQKDSQVVSLFALSGSASAKALHSTLMKKAHLKC